MDEEAILEAERHRMEQIRELDFEELQVEEVGDDDLSDDDASDAAGTVAPDEFTFNICLASLHTYLGEVEDTHHRLAFLDGGAVLTLPLFYPDGVVLFPDARLPLRVVQPNFISAVERALTQVDAPYTIGVVHVHWDPVDRRLRVATVGTTAEIRQYRRLEDGSMNVVTRGQQRFRLRRRWMDVEGVPYGEVQIIQEDLPLRTPRDAVGKLSPLRNVRSHNLSHAPISHISSHGDFNADNDSDANSEESFNNELSPEEKRIHQSTIDSVYGYDILDESTSIDNEKLVSQSETKLRRSDLNDSDSVNSSSSDHVEITEYTTIGTGNASSSGNQIYGGKRLKCSRKRTDLSQFRRAPRAFWPYWTYHMYDSYILAQKAADMWKQIIKEPDMDGFVKKPDLLSFYIASKIPVSESTRQELLEIDGISYRLRREIDLLKSFDLIRCKNCQTVIARRSDMLVMSSEGPVGAYVNSHGFVHEIMTLFRANSLTLIGRPATEYSWFPGYAWTIANCTTCETHMGWLFTAAKRKLKPQSFWGIRSARVADGMR